MGRKKKPRIIIEIVTEVASLEFRHVKGDELPDGGVSDGPTKAQYDIAFNAVAALLGQDLEEVKKKKEANEQPQT